MEKEPGRYNHTKNKELADIREPAARFLEPEETRCAIRNEMLRSSGL